ncbi:uncharacterized protein AB675_5959 [Cyphellophora attinorum]|uniref:Uncharacterized protein n=1 Tax=Cyphellophora attinorum TaxID=1664694 RepID=A0A0N0NL76_9EURO|nr:uncharacterized protein AB675_5959 [Phialophora attinorum]KPI38858.1 hypothetical protein AB675_5959 [Phialophora attinorum]
MESPVYTTTDGTTLTVPNCIRKPVDTLQCYCIKPDNPTAWQTIHYNFIWTVDRFLWLLGSATMWYLVYHYVVKDVYHKLEAKKRADIQREAERMVREKEAAKAEDDLVERALERIRRARALGKSDVQLTQAEIDALERVDRGLNPPRLPSMPLAASNPRAHPRSKRAAAVDQ